MKNVWNCVCFFLLPKAAIMPNIMQNIPPTIGSGMIIKTAPNLLIIP